MATTYTNDIQKLYVAYFNRPADPKGLAYWEGVVEAANGDTSAVSAAFAASTEYQDTYKGMSNADVVNAVYNNLFGHDADSAGKTYWANLLDAKSLTVDAVVTAIAGGAQGTDMTAYNDKVTAASAFTAAVDTDAEIAGYAGDANAAAKTWLSGITDSTSLTAALDAGALATTVATVVAAGTPFTVAGALAQMNADQKALDTFIKSVDVDNDSTTVTVASDITAAETTALNKVAADLTGGALGTQGTLFVADSTTDAVRSALISAQEATNAAKLAADQKTLADDNTAISKVAGLTAAVTTLTAATTALKAAQDAETAAHADVLAKEASFPVTNKGTLNVDLVNHVITLTTTADGTVTLADIGTTTGKATIADGITASDYTGLTDLISSYNAEVSALNNVDKAQSSVDFAQLNVNMLDVATAGAITADGVTYTEKALVAEIAKEINDTTAKTVADGATPTVAQIQTELAVLNAQTDHTAYNHFNALITAETNAVNSALTSANNALIMDQGQLIIDQQAAISAQNTYAIEATAFQGGTDVTMSNGSLVFTASGDTTPTTLATIDGTGHAVADAGALTTYGANLTTLVNDFNANVNAAAAVTTDQSNITADQLAIATQTAVSLNPLTDKQAADTDVVTADTKAISALAKAVTALNTAEANVNTLKGLQATVDADAQVLVDKGYNVVTMDAAHSGLVTQFGTAASDVFIVNGHDATIAAFGLQGTDSLFVGTGYTVVNGAIGDKGVTPSDTAMEIFVSNNADGNAQLQIETHAYSSSVATTAGEIVTITLTGVDAASLHLSNDGIITSTPAAA